MAFLDIPGHDNLPLLTRLEKHAFSENVFSSQIVARGLLDVFRDVSHSDKDILAVMEVAVRLSKDAEPTVRTELMEQIPPVIAILQESRLDFPVVVSQYLMPVILRYLVGPDKQSYCSPESVLCPAPWPFSGGCAPSCFLHAICPVLGAVTQGQKIQPGGAAGSCGARSNFPVRHRRQSVSHSAGALCP